MPLFPEENEEAFPDHSLLRKPYRYLGRGRQCYAFESFDGSTVLKIPRLDRYCLPLRWQALPNSRKKREISEDRQKRLSFTLESFRIASQELEQDTGVLYLHLRETEGLPKELTLYDRLHRPFRIDPNRIAFVLQKKRPLMMPAFLAALKKGDRSLAENILDSYLKVIETRSLAGIFNKDPSFLKNFGYEIDQFGHGKGVQIDIGSFYRKADLSPEDAYQEALLDSTGPIRAWLAKVDPWIALSFELKLEECLQKKPCSF